MLLGCFYTTKFYKVTHKFGSASHIKPYFCEIKAHAEFVKRTLQDAVGYGYDGNIHFARAYYPVIFHDRVEIWKGDTFAGSVGIDPVSGLLKINTGGDFGPMEWFKERTESVFKSASIDSIKEAMGRYCLDEGICIFDKNRTSNLQTANDDVARSKDSRLLDIVNSMHCIQSVELRKC